MEWVWNYCQKHTRVSYRQAARKWVAQRPPPEGCSPESAAHRISRKLREEDDKRRRPKEDELLGLAEYFLFEAFRMLRLVTKDRGIAIDLNPPGANHPIEAIDEGATPEESVD